MNEPLPGSRKQKRSFWLRLLSWKVLLPLLILLAVVSTPFFIRQHNLSQVPPIDVPFDIKKYETIAITDEENGYVEYKQALTKLIMSSKPKPFRSPEGEFVDDLDLAHDERDWSHATPAVKKWLKDNQEALTIWKKGTQKPKFLIEHPKNISLATTLDVQDNAYVFGQLAVLNAKRIAFEGKREESKEWLQAIFLSGCQLNQHGNFLIRLRGDVLCSISVIRMFWWAGNSDVTAIQLQQAMRDQTQNELQMIPLTTTLRYEYFTSKNHYLSGQFKKWCQLDDPVKDSNFSRRIIWDIKFFMKGEPDRSWRLHQHVLANLLTEIDKPISDQSPQTTKYQLFKHPPKPSSTSRILPADKLERMVLQSKYTSENFLLDGSLSFLSQRRKTRRSILQIILAAQIYKRKHGDFPATTADLLAEGDLKTMPLDATKQVKTKITYRHKQGFTVVYIVRKGDTDQGGIDANWGHPERDYGYVLEGRTPGVEY